MSKTLAEYLADYIETEMDREGFEYMAAIPELIKRGIEAYESTENVNIVTELRGGK